jgi:hypothetical protein
LGHQGYQVIVAPVVKQCRLDYGARGYDTNNFAVDKASCALVSGLFAAPTTHPTSQMARNAAAYLLYDSYLVASRDKAGYIGIGGVIGDTCQRYALILSNWSGCQGDVANLGYYFSIFVKGLIEITQSEEDNGIWILPLDS